MRDRSESKVSPKPPTGMKQNVIMSTTGVLQGKVQCRWSERSKFVFQGVGVEMTVNHLNSNIKHKSGAGKKCLDWR